MALIEERPDRPLTYTVRWREMWHTAAGIGCGGRWRLATDYAACERPPCLVGRAAGSVRSARAAGRHLCRCPYRDGSTETPPPTPTRSNGSAARDPASRSRPPPFVSSARAATSSGSRSRGHRRGRRSLVCAVLPARRSRRGQRLAVGSRRGVDPLPCRRSSRGCHPVTGPPHRSRRAAGLRVQNYGALDVITSFTGQMIFGLATGLLYSMLNHGGA